MSVPIPIEGIGPLPEPLARLFERNAVVTCEQAYELLERTAPGALGDGVGTDDLARIREKLRDLLGDELIERLERLACEDWVQRFRLGALPPEERDDDEGGRP